MNYCSLLLYMCFVLAIMMRISVHQLQYSPLVGPFFILFFISFFKDFKMRSRMTRKMIIFCSFFAPIFWVNFKLRYKKYPYCQHTSLHNLSTCSPMAPKPKKGATPIPQPPSGPKQAWNVEWDAISAQSQYELNAHKRVMCVLVTHVWKITNMCTNVRSINV